MSDPDGTVFLLDVDNTLLNNDLFQFDLKRHVAEASGPDARDRYWAIQAELFHSLGYRDYLGAFQRYRLERPHDPAALLLAGFVIDYPYERLLYPGALDVVARLRTRGRVVLLTDGDAVFQPRKLLRSGLAAAADGVVIAVHKEHELDMVEARYPAQHYVLVDDKRHLLAAAKAYWGSRVTTVFPRQGQFAFDGTVASNPPADVTLTAIADLIAEPPLPFMLR